jgi:HK97 gp10 family phage protein
MANIEWQGDQFIEAQRKALGDNLEAAAIFLVEKVKDALNEDQPYKKSTDSAIITRVGGKTVHKVKRQRTLKGVYYYGLDPSQGGDAPHKLTGHLQRSITYAMSDDREHAYVGTSLEYGLYLEIGTSKMQARPFLRPTLAANQETIAKIVATGKK